MKQNVPDKSQNANKGSGKAKEEVLEFARSLRESLRDLDPIKRRGPRVLYHYTTSVGIAGILSSGHLRATNFSFLNDASEFRYGVNVVLERFEAEARKRTPQNTWPLLVGVGGDVLLREMVSLSETYLVCFTERRDDLSQWRGYGGGTDRFCVGFDVARLLNGVNCSFAPVTYSRRKQLRILDAYINTTYAELERSGLQKSDPLIAATVHVLCRWIIEVLSFFKDSHFSSEREWRAVQNLDRISKDELYFDTTTGTIRPYIRLFETDTNLPITEIIVQSARQDERARKSIELLLRRYGYDGVKIFDSKVPFRFT